MYSVCPVCGRAMLGIVDYANAANGAAGNVVYNYNYGANAACNAHPIIIRIEILV